MKKKHNAIAIAYHQRREAQAAGIVRIAKENGATNLADLFTKSLAGSDAPLAQAFWHKVIW